MACQTIYAEMMSLHLDGQLDNEDERRLLDHVADCGACSPFWDAMREADSLFLASASQPVLVPVEFHVKVLAHIASTSVVHPQLETAASPKPVYEIPGAISALPPFIPALGHYEPLPPIHLPEYMQQWQQRVSGYVRGLAAAGLTLTLAVGLLAVLVVSGIVQVGGPFGSFVEGVRTFISAAYTWARSLLGNIGVEATVGGAFLLAMLVVAGWQVVSGYQRATSRHWQEAATAESAA